MKPKVLFAALLRFFLTGFGPGFSKDVTESPPRVETPLGTIEGHFSVSSGGKSFEVYQGIPYAKPPTGELRFEAPEGITPWTGILKAKRLGPECIQYGHIVDDIENRVEGAEDCLYLNVYTPIRRKNENAESTDSLFPVIFYIHGGAFIFGSGILYGPKYLLDRDITLVTINYRLGPLGFLSTEDDVVPGNMGLKDQAMALRWVSENIKFFGGDPSRVTIVGQSAGGASVHYHYLSKLSAGLFQRGISVSGCVLNSWPQTEASFEKAKKLATIVGCPSEESQAIVDCLKSRPAHQIVQAVEEFMPWLYNPYSPFGPVVEKKGGKSAPFIDRPPMEILASGEVQDLPWITSVTSEEGLYPTADFVASEKLLKELNENWETIAPHLLDFNYTIPQKDHAKVSKLIKQHYLGTKPIDKSTVNQIIKLVGDRLFVYHILEAAKLQAKVNKSPVWFYYFTYRGSHSLSEIMSGSNENFGVSHADDIPYVLDTIFDSSTSPEDREMQKKYIDFWVSYATEGKPNVGIEWPAVSKSTDDFQHLNIAGPKNLGIRDRIEIGEKSFWKGISFRENIYDSKTANGNRKTEL